MLEEYTTQFVSPTDVYLLGYSQRCQYPHFLKGEFIKILFRLGDKNDTFSFNIWKKRWTKIVN